jgi:hypothetical protein
MHAESPKHHWLQVFCKITQLIAWGKRVRVPHLHGVDGGWEPRRVSKKVAVKERKQHAKHKKYFTLGHQGACIPS